MSELTESGEQTRTKTRTRAKAFMRSHSLHDFFHGWGRQIDGSSSYHDVLWHDECPSVYKISEVNFRLRLAAKKLRLAVKRIGRRFSVKKKRIITFGPIIMPRIKSGKPFPILFDKKDRANDQQDRSR